MNKLKGSGRSIEKSWPGDIKKRINSKKKAVLGEVGKDEGTLRKHYQFLEGLQKEIKNNGVPLWV